MQYTMRTCHGGCDMELPAHGLLSACADVFPCMHNTLQTCQIANWLKSVGVKKGEDVTLYMPMVPELPAAMLVRGRGWSRARSWRNLLRPQQADVEGQGDHLFCSWTCAASCLTTL